MDLIEYYFRNKKMKMKQHTETTKFEIIACNLVLKIEVYCRSGTHTRDHN